MKKYLFIFLGLMTFAACQSNTEQNKKESEEIVGEAYGPEKVDIANAITVKEFFEDFEKQDSSKFYTIKGKMSQICTKAGCWVGINKELGNDDYFTVKFKDHFTVPLDSPLDQDVYVRGVATWQLITVEEKKQEALADGASKEEIDAITEGEYIFTFLSDGIVLTK